MAFCMDFFHRHGVGVKKRRFPGLHPLVTVLCCSLSGVSDKADSRDNYCEEREGKNIMGHEVSEIKNGIMENVL